MHIYCRGSPQRIVGDSSDIFVFSGSLKTFEKCHFLPNALLQCFLKHQTDKSADDVYPTILLEDKIKEQLS